MATFVALEGPDGVGKSTLHTNLCLKLTAKGYINPGATKFGVEVRRLIKSNLDISQYATQILMASDFVNFIETMAAEDNKVKDRVVILDRANFISGYNYGKSSGLSDEQLKPFQRIIWEALNKHNIMIHIINIMAPLPIINKRRAKRLGNKDRFEARDDSFQRSVYEHYYNLSKYNLNTTCYGSNIPRFDSSILTCIKEREGKVLGSTSIWSLDGSKSEKRMLTDAVNIINIIKTLQLHNAFFREHPDHPNKK